MEIGIDGGEDKKSNKRRDLGQRKRVEPFLSHMLKFQICSPVDTTM